MPETREEITEDAVIIRMNDSHQHWILNSSKTKNLSNVSESVWSDRSHIGLNIHHCYDLDVKVSKGRIRKYKKDETSGAFDSRTVSITVGGHVIDLHFFRDKLEDTVV